MDTAMAHPRNPHPRHRLTRALASAATLIALAAPASAHAIASETATTPGEAATTPLFAPSTTSPSTTTTTPGARSVTHTSTSHASKLSTPAIAAAALAALIALCCVVWGIARLQAFEPRWTLSLRHAMGEAGFRASATWAEFSDWVRLGR